MQPHGAVQDVHGGDLEDRHQRRDQRPRPRRLRRGDDHHHSSASNNGSNGLRAFDPGAIIRFSNMTITGNVTRGLSVNGGQLISLGTNFVLGNGTDGTPTSTVSPI